MNVGYMLLLLKFAALCKRLFTQKILCAIVCKLEFIEYNVICNQFIFFMTKKKFFKVKKSYVKDLNSIIKEDKAFRFPHISRFFTASFVSNFILIFLTVSFLAAITLNYIYPVSSFEWAKINLFLKPYEAKSYLTLADLYILNNDYLNAKRELKNAVYFSNNEHDKVEATRKLLMIERSEFTKQEIENQISKWEKISVQKPNYRDAYFQLAVLNYQIFNNNASRIYLEKAMYLDPNFDEGKRLKALLN